MRKNREKQRKIQKREQNGQRTIKDKLMKTVLILTFISLALVGTISIILNLYSNYISLEHTMTESVEIASKSVENKLEGYKKLAKEISNIDVFRDEKSTKQQILNKCEVIRQRNEFTAVSVTDANGIDLAKGTDLSERDYFKQAKETKEVAMSDPLVRKDDGTMNIFIASPILRNDEFAGIVFMGVDATFLCDIVSEISIGKTGEADIINANGDTIADKNLDYVLNSYNVQEEAKKNSKLKKLAQIESDMTKGKTGFATYKENGKNKFIAYNPINGTNGWSIGILVNRSEFMNLSYLAVIIVVILTIVSLVICAYYVKKLAYEISDPINQCVERIKLLAEGDLHSEVPVIKTGDETETLAEASATIVNGLNLIIGDIKFLLGELAKGDFTVVSSNRERYIGDYHEILVSVRAIKDSLSDTMYGIKEASSQVSAGSAQMADSATALAEGATDQAGAVEELQATISDVTEQVERNAEETVVARKAIDEVNEIAEKSTMEMQKMVEAMERISKNSQQIEAIIGTIEDIASQTNLLSLNASIEAARAGEVGRGFAVVAGEIGTLANQSAQAVVNTRDLISVAVNEVKVGNSISEETAKYLQEVKNGLEDVLHSIDTVSKASQQQAESMEQINLGVEQISEVVQSNSATAEETSATSEELMAQATTLDEWVQKFKLRNH